jgi:GNAT superfamily N-acetyltransferase
VNDSQRDETVLVVSVSVRLAEARDADEIADVHASAWRAAFTFLPARFLEAMAASAVVGKWEGDLARPTTSLFVAIDRGGIVGFLQLRADGHAGEVMALYVDPSRWGQSVGSTLLAFGEAWLVAEGADAGVLWTAKESQQSRTFYEHRGWVPTGEEQTQHLGPTDVPLHEIEYRKWFAPSSTDRA